MTVSDGSIQAGKDADSPQEMPYKTKYKRQEAIVTAKEVSLYHELEFQMHQGIKQKCMQKKKDKLFTSEFCSHAKKELSFHMNEISVFLNNISLRQCIISLCFLISRNH